MNGAAKSYQQEDDKNYPLNSCSEARGFFPGYHLDNSHPQHSKVMNFDNNSVGTFKHGDQYSYSRDYQSVYRRTDGSQSQQYKVPFRVPLELPVPKFEIDENYVGESIRGACSVPKVENSSELDLDTRINFLIKSKALAGMHPIFSQLESEESCNESDDPFGGSFKTKKKKRRTRSPLSVEHVEHFDDPEMPLSRPPSPFLTRATYLFWFNKAKELKKQAKAQEQELLEKAAKKLLQENSTSVKKTDKETSNQETQPVGKNVLDEICSEIKVIVKSEFIEDVFEDAVFSKLEQWWERNCQKNIAVDALNTCSIADSTSEASSLKLIKNDVISVTGEANRETENNERIPNFKHGMEITENLIDHKDGAKVEGQCCSSSLDVMNASEYSSSNQTFYKEENKNDIINEEDVFENKLCFNFNTIPRINQPVLDESSLFLPFPSSSDLPEVPIHRFDNENEDKNEIVLTLLSTIIENVFRHTGI